MLSWSSPQIVEGMVGDECHVDGVSAVNASIGVEQEVLSVTEPRCKIATKETGYPLLNLTASRPFFTRMDGWAFF